MRDMQHASPRIVVIGGGTGSFTMLSALKAHTSNLTALVNMTDSGGSSGVLRDELDVLPPGDIRQCLVALSTASEELRSLFNFRFPSGNLAGHSFGNLFLSAVESMTSNFDDAVRLAGDVLRIQGRVLPITLDDCNLVMYTDEGKIVGEYKIANQTFSSGRPDLSLEPQATITQAARQAILDADLIVIAPGDLYASLAPNMLVAGTSEALQATKAKVAFVCNMVNKPNHTRGYAVTDYASEIERFANAEILDYVFYNKEEPNPKLLDKYMREDEYPVVVDADRLAQAHYVAVGGKFLSKMVSVQDEHDTAVRRSLIRHDHRVIATALMELC